uniref:Uncharacterized protein n=1 Tax=Meloidogyne javanica TaxID=6303 RepID=A0A915MTG9_MELJA
MMYFGWILQILYYTVADKLAEKLFKSNAFEGGTVLANIEKKIKLDENRYKDFRKNHLNRIIQNFDTTRPSTSSFPPTPPNEENDTDKNSLDSAQNPKCLASSFVYPNIKTVFLLVNGNVNDNELNKLKEL